MKSYLLLLSFLHIILGRNYSQNSNHLSLNIGDTPPTLQIGNWLKGEPIQKFEKGKVYVIELWATWCGPCIASMPHLSALANQYKGKVIFLGIDVKERKTTSLEKVKSFVDSLGSQMDYSVATDNNNYIVQNWLSASGEQGIPKTFVVDANTILAWIGHPSELDKVLPEIVNNNWDLKKELYKKRVNNYLEKMDDSVNTILQGYKYIGDYNNNDYIGHPDSALIMIKKIIEKEPRLKYAPLIAFQTFRALLKTNMQKAYEYGKVAIVTTTYDEPAYHLIIGTIESYSDKLKLTKEIYRLGAETYQEKIKHIIYPEKTDIYKYYSEMATWYWRAGNKSEAIRAQRKAIENLKSKNNISTKMLAAFESQFEQYKRS